MFGLTDAELKFIQESVVLPLAKIGAKIYCFGSRAQGNHIKFSDLDLLVRVRSEADLSNIRNILASINETLVQSNFPYKVDLVLELDLAESYRSNVRAQLKEILP